MAVSKTLRYQILRRDNNTCRTCGRSAPEVKLHVDHVVPEALGGRTEPSNLQTLCADCNGGKSATPADAAMIQQVSADALRWADAQKIVVARMLAGRQATTAVYARVDAVWNNWCGGKLPRSADWRQSVDQLLGAGLPLEMFTDAIDIACGNTSIQEKNLWRYACGIGWNRVSEIREATSAEVAPVVSSQPEAREVPAERDEWEMTGWNQGRSELARQILDHLEDNEKSTMLADARVEALDEGDEIDDTDPEGSPYLLGRAALSAFQEYRARARRMEKLAALVMSELPTDLRTEVLSDASSQLHGAHPEGYTDFDLAWWSFYHFVDRLKTGAAVIEWSEALVDA